MRAELKEPLGSIFSDVDALLAEVEGPLIAVGDVVAFHLERAGRSPDVAVIDERTEREPVSDEIREVLAGADVDVENPPATLTEELLDALRDAVDEEAPVRIRVDGEEDLATLPAIVAAPDGASVVYGQPGEGMVLVRVTPEARVHARRLLERMDGDPEQALAFLNR